MEITLLSYLSNWETWVEQNQSIPKEQKIYCTLSQQTVEGIRICGKCSSSCMWIWSSLLQLILAHTLPEMTKFLLSHRGANYILTERFNRDKVEIFLGQQRTRGHCIDNPSVSQFVDNTQAIIIQKSLAIGGSSSISHKRSTPDLSSLCRPLPKCRCNREIKFD